MRQSGRRDLVWLLLAVPLAAPERPLAGQAVPKADTVIMMRSVGPNLEFIPDELAVEQGTRVILRYVNDGDLPHNLALVRDEADIDMLVAAAYEAQGTGFIPVEHSETMIAYSPLVSPGQTVDIEFVVPPPGEYVYICLFPGHASMMLGTLYSLP